MYKYLLCLLLFSLPLLSSASVTNTAKIKVSSGDFKKHFKITRIFKINGLAFEYIDGEHVFPVKPDNTLDTVFYSDSTTADTYKIYALCKFRSNETYYLNYNMCDNQIKIWSNDSRQENTSVRAMIRNYKGKETIKLFTQWGDGCEYLDDGEGGFRLKNNILSKEKYLYGDCLGAMCSNWPVSFEIGTSRPYRKIKGGFFQPLHPSKEKLIFEYDFATGATKLYLE